MTLADQQRAQMQRKREKDDLAEVLALPAGRRVLSRLLAQLYGTYYAGASDTVLREFAALHDKAVALESELARAAPAGYRLLKAEQLDENLLNLQVNSRGE